MASKNRTTSRINKSATPHRLKKRFPTRITATPRHANVSHRPVVPVNDAEEEIETARDDYFSLPLPTSPAPSPPRPKELCPQSKCTLTGSPNQTQMYTYRKIYDENDKTQRDALGRETAGRHRFPASEVAVDRYYMTPSSRVLQAHGIQQWPDPPMLSRNVSAMRKQGTDFDSDIVENNTVTTTRHSMDSRERRHSTKKKRVVRPARRLIFDESEGAEGDDEEDEVEKEHTPVHTLSHSHPQGDTRGNGSSRKRRASKMSGVKFRRRLYSGSVMSDGVRVMTSSEEATTIDESNFSGNTVIVDDEHSIVDEGDLNRTLEVEQEEKEDADIDEEHASGDGQREDCDERKVDGNEEDEEEDEMRVEGDEEELEEDEMVEEVGSEKEDSAQGQEGSGDSESTLQEEIMESEEGEVDSEHVTHSVQDISVIGDIPAIDNTLPLDDVVESITDEHIRRLLAVCKQKDVMDMNEFMTGIISGVKVGEGGFAEVFKVKRTWDKEERVFKILKIGEGEDAGKFFGEVIISKELTRLHSSGRNSTNAFARMYRSRVIRGLFPPLLSDAWEQFRAQDDDALNEENPESLGEEQMFLCLECEYGGLNLRKFPFSSVFEVISVYCQTALALAVAESEFRFEHRDLHEENVLVKRTDEKVVEFSYDRSRSKGQKGEIGGGHECTSVPTRGVKTTIIDFTLSRMTRKPESRGIIRDVDINHELDDEICEQEGEEQYQVYRTMKKLTKGNWSAYTPKSNVLWLKMQINWIIKENLNPKSDVNKKRVENAKIVNASKTNENAKKVSRRPSRRRSLECLSDGEEDSAEMWIKKLKEGTSLIKKIKAFAKGVNKFESAEELVDSKEFGCLLALLK